MSIIFTDDFSGTNGTIGAGWSPNTAESDPSGFFRDGSGNAQPASDNWNQDISEQRSGDTYPNDQWAEITLTAPNTGGVGAGMGLALRMASASAKTYYRIVANQNGWELSKFVTGTFTSLATGTTAFATGDTLYGQVVGTTITVKKGTTSGSGGTTLTASTGSNPATDSAIGSGKTGLAYSSADNNSKINNFVAGDFGTGPVSDGADAIYRSPKSLGTPLSRLRGAQATDQQAQLSALGLSATVGAGDLQPLLINSSSPFVSRAPGFRAGTPFGVLKAPDATDHIGQLSALGLSFTVGMGDMQTTPFTSPSFNSPELDLGTPLAKLRSRYVSDQPGSMQALGLSVTTGSAQLLGTGALRGLGLSSTVGFGSLSGGGALTGLGLSATVGFGGVVALNPGSMEAKGLSSTVGMAFALQQLLPNVVGMYFYDATLLLRSHGFAVIEMVLQDAPLPIGIVLSQRLVRPLVGGDPANPFSQVQLIVSASLSTLPPVIP